jgi:hypothetical protein
MSGFTWGLQKHTGEIIEGIKLLLDVDQPRPLWLPKGSVEAGLQRLGKSPVEIAGDYMTAIYEHAMSKIDSAAPEDFMKKCQKQFVLSVPAVWSDKAKDPTLQVSPTHPTNFTSIVYLMWKRRQK